MPQYELSHKNGRDSRLIKGRKPSGNCATNRHSQCNGRGHASPGSIWWVCTCSCHKVAPESEDA